MELNIFGLKCDAPACNYENRSIEFEQYEEYINYPCPECGAPLLTQADYDATLRIVKIATLASKLDYVTGCDLNSLENDKTYKLNIQLDGTGVPKIEIGEIK